LSILRQAWPQYDREIETRAIRLATATLRQLQAAGKTEQAQQFQSRLEETKVRDCVFVARWTGDADVDVLVEEPAGTVCSLRNERTTSGGVMLGDGFASSKSNSASADGYSEVYVCPEAFSGQYRVLLRRVWGDITAGKVTVGFCTNGSPYDESSWHWDQIPLAEEDAMVVFEVAHGRRKQPLADHVVANVSRKHLEVGRAVLAQQVASLADPQAFRDFAVGRFPCRPPGLPRFCRGATGGPGRRLFAAGPPGGGRLSAGDHSVARGCVGER
jgi:hypothetical protein